MDQRCEEDRNPDLGRTCQKLFCQEPSGCKDTSSGVVTYQSYGQSIADLERNAGLGCAFCRLRWTSLTRDQRSQLTACMRISYGYWNNWFIELWPLENSDSHLTFGYHDKEGSDQNALMFSQSISVNIIRGYIESMIFNISCTASAYKEKKSSQSPLKSPEIWLAVSQATL
jgi:hypothetical protein